MSKNVSKNAVSRRSLLSAAIAAAGAGVLASVPMTAGAATATPAADVVWTDEADVVVVGFGGAGAAAAIEASRAGAGVIVLELADHPGGSTKYNGGFIMMAGTKLQEQFGIEDSPENFFNYLCAAGGANASAEHIKVVADASPELYDWCVGCGMDFESGQCDTEHHLGGYNAGFSLGYSGNEQSRVFADVASPAPRGHMPQPGSSGLDMIEALSATVESLDIDVRLETPATSLVLGEDGRVAGVVAEGPDGQIAVKANRAVVMTAGGFANNAAMLDDYYPMLHPRGENIVAAGNENGSGILMGQAAGAALRGMGCFQIGSTIVTRQDEFARGILVDGNGRRIVAEDEYNSFIGKAIIMAPTDECYLILNEEDALSGDAAAAYGDPLAVVGTVEEIAGATGIDADVLSATVAFYNESVDLGEDREYGKHAQYLAALEQGPFHVFVYGPERCYTGSLGGLKIDTAARVLDVDGNVIPGLYAAGRNAGSIYGWYMGSGSSMADVLTFGCIAGRNAATE